MTPTWRTSGDVLARRALHLALGALLLGQAAFLVLHRPAAEAFARMGLPDWVRLLLAWAEIIAAALFLWPRTLRIGGSLLILVLLGAIALHLGRGEFPAPLVIYILVILTFIARPRG